MSETLHFAEHTLQEVALVIMAIVYGTRIFWFTRFKAGAERQAKTGLPDTNKKKGILYSMANVMMPWAMESTRNNLIVYGQFVIFHLGVILAILQSFLIPYAPQLMEPVWVTRLFQIVIGLAFLVGLIRIIRRIAKPVMRAISSPDDHFSLWLITIWFLFAALAAPNNYQESEIILLTYFYLTAFFLIYVPFSKISHYLYYPFTRFYFGRSMGHRGGYPVRGTRKA